MTQHNATSEVDVAIIGAGFAGLYALHKLRDDVGLTARVFETGSGPGGTWYWNRYPGARVDIPSMQYSYQFDDDLQQEWEWREKYAPQSEILEYVDHVVERFDLGKDIQYDSRVVSSIYDDDSGKWTLTLDNGDQCVARYCIMSTGCLSAANKPHFTGDDTFEGEVYHTGRWPHEGVDLKGKTVGIIGTGSSAVQSIPLIAEACEHLTVFQRTPNFSAPAYNEPLDPDYAKAVKADYQAFRQRGQESLVAWDIEMNEKNYAEMSAEELKACLDERWEMGGLFFYGALADLLTDQQANDVVSEFVRDKIRSKVEDPQIAELLTPKTMIGCKRICADTNYFETYNRDNVTLVDISQTPISELTPGGLRVGDQSWDFDIIVYATGFDALTGSLDRIDIRGRHGLTLKEKWAAGPLTMLGLQSAGFPNMFIIANAGSPSVLTNMITSIEQHVEWIADAIRYVRQSGATTMETTEAAEDDWVNHTNEVASETLLLGCNSWYLGANIPGKPRVFMPYLGYADYRQKCDEIAAEGYPGFKIT